MPTLAHSLVTAPGATPSRFLLFLHGILGRGANLRVIARRLVEARPDWGVVLVDLPMHGGSQGFSPPYTVAAAADDLVALEAVLPAPVAGVLGHSFGGKVALEYLRRRADRLAHVFIVDASPSARAQDASDSGVRAALQVLESLPPVLPGRELLVDRAVAAGLSRPLGEWLAMNLTRDGGGWRLILDLGAIRAMLVDYLALDLWPLLSPPPGEARVHFILGDRSNTFTAADRARLESVEEAAPGRIDHVALPADHWVHADDPEGLVRVLVGVLGAGPATAP